MDIISKMKVRCYLFLRQLFLSADDLLYRFLLLFPESRKETQTSKKKVVFVIDSPGPRVYKIMKELHGEGWEIVSLCRVRRGKKIGAEVYRYSSEVKQYISAHGALFRCRPWRGGLFHIFCCYSYDLPELLIREDFGKVIFDNYDGYAGFLAEWNRTKRNLKTAEKERYCLENADGLTCRSLETQYNKRRMGYRFKGKRLLFLDYCSRDSVKSHDLNESPVFFYGGGLWDETAEKVSIYACFSETAEILSKHGCCFKVYYPSAPEKIVKYYKNIFKDISGSELHKPVPFDEMLEVMKGFDFAISPARGVDPKRYRNSLQSDDSYYVAKYLYSATNKFFDALDAGIPVVGASPYYILKILERKGMACYCPIEELDGKIEFLKEHYTEFQANIKKNIKRYSMKTQIHRLISFYEEIQKE